MMKIFNNVIIGILVISVLSLNTVTNIHATGTSSTDQRMEYLDNGVVRIGIDLSIGGAITYFSDLRGGDRANMVNSFDWGRQVQMSFYSGPNPYQPNGKKPKDNWKQLGWNPIQSGDCY